MIKIIFIAFSIFFSCVSPAAELADVYQYVMEVAAQEQNSIVPINSGIEDSDRLFNSKFFHKSGHCRPQSLLWNKLLRKKWKKNNSVTVKLFDPVGNGNFSTISFNTNHGLKDIGLCHCYNVVSQGPEQKIIVDSTYLQFFTEDLHKSMSPIFVGNQEDLIALAIKYKEYLIMKIIKLCSTEFIYLVNDDEIKKFVQLNWPID